jgi:hypothetical protein
VNIMFFFSKEDLGQQISTVANLHGLYPTPLVVERQGRHLFGGWYVGMEERQANEKYGNK